MFKVVMTREHIYGIPECTIPKGANTFSYQGGERKSLIPIPQRLKKCTKVKKAQFYPYDMKRKSKYCHG